MILVQSPGSPRYDSPASAGGANASRTTAGMLDLVSGVTKEIPLKQNWKRNLGEEIGFLSMGNSGRLYAVLPGSVKAVDADGKIAASFPVSGAVSAGESNGRVHILSQQVHVSECMYIPTKVDQSLQVFDGSGKPLWRHDWPREVQKTMGGFTAPVEDAAGNVWVKCNSKMYRFANGQMELVDACTYHHPLIASPDGSMITYWGEVIRYSPDLTKKSVAGHPDQFYLIGDQAYAASWTERKLYKLDFENETKKEILHWADDKNPVKPFVGKDGTANIILPCHGDGVRKSLWIAVDRDGKVMRRKELKLKVEFNTAPLVTPNGTLFVLGEQNTLYAIDKDNRLHSTALPEAPIGIFSGKGEGITVALKSGTLLSFEAQSTAALQQGKMEEADDLQTLMNLRDQWGGNPLFS